MAPRKESKMSDNDFKYLVLAGLSVITSLLGILVGNSSPDDKPYADSIVKEYARMLQDSIKDSDTP